MCCDYKYASHEAILVDEKIHIPNLKLKKKPRDTRILLILEHKQNVCYWILSIKKYVVLNQCNKNMDKNFVVKK